jgi:hypothetical protein
MTKNNQPDLKQKPKSTRTPTTVTNNQKPKINRKETKIKEEKNRCKKT